MNQELARTILLTHSRSPRNGLFPEASTLTTKLTNPICGDHVELKLALEGETVSDVGFKAQACAICTASASIMCEEIKGNTLEKIKILGSEFEKALLSASDLPWPTEMMSLGCFEHLRINPSRKACALLPWVAIRSALKNTMEGNT